MAVSLQSETQDRYHEISSRPTIDLGCLDNEIDFTLKPFNRKDVYSILLFITKISDDDSVDINLATKHPVKFVETPPYGSLATAVAVRIGKLVVESQLP
jgi:hypothetical protein